MMTNETIKKPLILEIKGNSLDDPFDYPNTKIP